MHEPEKRARVTFVQAAEILGCHVSNIPKLVAKGHLTVHRDPGRVRGHLIYDEVMDLASVRAVGAATTRVYVRRTVRDRRPDTDHDWLTPAQAGRVVGITAQGIHQRIRRETLPAVMNEGRWWIRRDHLELVEHAHAARRTRRA